MEDLEIPKMTVIVKGKECLRVIDYYNRDKDNMLIPYPVLFENEIIMQTLQGVVIYDKGG